MVIIKWHLHPKQVENRVDIYHDSDKDKKSHIESKYHKQLRVDFNYTYKLNR